jgi:hypothetical protein
VDDQHPIDMSERAGGDLAIERRKRRRVETL